MTPVARPSHLLRGFDRRIERRIGARFNRGQTRRDQRERAGTKGRDRDENTWKGRKTKRERQESKNTVYCSKWALTRSCVTTSSIAHKENARDREEPTTRRTKVRGAMVWRKR